MNGASFRWNECTTGHAHKHGCSIGEIEAVVLRHKPGRKIGDDKLMVVGRGRGGRWIREIYLIDDVDGRFYVIHAMPVKR